ncbi:hypothetical protein PR202_ga30986 [Eleusine coracana subsp. coracana]|uniref:Protein kinase domain-containing protein n=1 Tax=Eleusine coracana subsp. coracana TaxID=191504 RepID=A0AAV5DPT7_ELECO|nr:hypothetical protein PR202_ga30986 [Eleusine coracana subsp. coracana]
MALSDFNFEGFVLLSDVIYFRRGGVLQQQLHPCRWRPDPANATAASLAFVEVNWVRRWKKEQDKLAKIMQDLPGVPTKIEFTDIKRATRNFHDTMKLGKGGFGAVYRCTLPASASRTGEPMEVAVNKFLAEVSIINRLRHKNIVPLLGWSYHKGVPVLVYEYMTNGTLDQHLFRRREEDATISHWDTRYNIVRDIATGLHYVRHEHEPMVLHRDIKASNIMLDSTFRARLGDFGIACTVAANKSYVNGIAGTFGYIGPDYATTGTATRKTDTYPRGCYWQEEWRMCNLMTLF